MWSKILTDIDQMFPEIEKLMFIQNQVKLGHRKELWDAKLKICSVLNTQFPLLSEFYRMSSWPCVSVRGAQIKRRLPEGSNQACRDALPPGTWEKCTWELGDSLGIRPGVSVTKGFKNKWIHISASNCYMRELVEVLHAWDAPMMEDLLPLLAHKAANIKVDNLGEQHCHPNHTWTWVRNSWAQTGK